MEQPRFRQLSVDERLAYLQAQGGLTDAERALLAGDTAVGREVAENLIENAVGYFGVPLGIATGFRIDGRDVLVPMAVEETSIIAAASAAAKWVRACGEIRTRTLGSLIIGQIQLPRVADPPRARAALDAGAGELVQLANAMVPNLVERGGGVRAIETRELPRSDGAGTMMVLHVLCDARDAMGANLINQICEGLKPRVEAMTGEHVGLSILSNLVDGRRVEAEVELRGIDPALGAAIAEAVVFAETDPYRAATHNKGVLNGIDPILVATGNDWRAVEAGVHAWAARSGRYQPVTSWRARGGNLTGRIDVPLAVGTVGGMTRVHPLARAALRILGVEHADDLARVCAAVGLVQNLAALKALTTVGIVRGHMELHAANLALAAGSSPAEVPQVRARLSQLLADKQSIGISAAEGILREMRARAGAGAQPVAEVAAPVLDVERYQDHLDRVSRSFAFCIRRLDAPLRGWVALSYLLCRALDTVEDSPWSDPGERAAQFERFESFVRALPRPEEVRAWAERFPASIPAGERRLLDDAHFLFQDLHRLPVRQRRDIADTVLRMAGGMQHYAEQHTRGGTFRLRDLGEVNRYCYFVAGIVGELLTRLVIAHRPAFRPRADLLKDAYHFGLFLQKVNVLKDQREDEGEGRFLVPDRAELFASLRENADGALRYLTSLPHDEPGYRTFCAWSLFLGLASLPWIHASFRDQSDAKIPREVTEALIAEVAGIATDDAALMDRARVYLAVLPPTSRRARDSLTADDGWFQKLSGCVLTEAELRELGLGIAPVLAPADP